MKLHLSAADEAFQQEVRAFLRDHWDANATLVPGPRLWAAERAYIKQMAQRGWLAGQWPRRLGGADWSDLQRLLWEREAAAVCAPQMPPGGVDLLGPLLREVGTPEQKNQHLPSIADGSVSWSEAFVEDSGALDITRLTCRARSVASVREATVDDWVLSGEKPWVLDVPPQGRGQSVWFYVLAVTGGGADRPSPNTEADADTGTATDAAELSLFLVDSTAPGITVTPRPMIGESGVQHAVNQVSFDQVRLPSTALVGKRGSGADYAGLLERKRFELPGVLARNQGLCAQLRRYLEDVSDSGAGELWHDEDFRARLHSAEVELEGLLALESRAWSQDSTLDPAGKRGLRLAVATRTEPLNQQLADLQVEALGYFALPFVDFSALDNEGPIGPEFAQPALLGMLSDRARGALAAPREHLKNIIAKSVLALPENADQQAS